ncbi:efflux RND transporter permease subunit [Klebsiella oxytoca]|uniref:efflux RND transporter permease subunit n=1 Tax=Klebsiella oxytoca TaxID=571 RepID=UPI002930E76B|nr:efflux RND transporter permease subunit [Klebsiella oxytoca]
MEGYIRFIEKYSRWILFILLLITLLFAWKITDLTEDSNPYMLSESHPSRKAIADIREDFTGTYDSVLIVINNKESVFNQATLNAVFTLTEQARKLILTNDDDVTEFLSIMRDIPADSPWNEQISQIRQRGFTQSDAILVKSIYDSRDQFNLSNREVSFLRFLVERIDPIKEMAGMSATENAFLIDGDTLKAAVTINNIGVDPEMARNALMNNELMNMGVVNRDGKVTMITIELGILPDDSVAQMRAYQIITEMVDNYKREHPTFVDDIYIAGVPVFFAEQTKTINHDMKLLFPITILVVFGLLGYFLRNRYGVLIPLFNVVSCVIWTLGMMAIVGTPLDLITSVLPVFLVTICSSDAIHIMVEYKHQIAQGKNLRDANRAMMRLMTRPVILTTLATCTTFILSTTTNIVNLRNFGIYMTFGMFVALIISLLMIPAMLHTFKYQREVENAEQEQERPTSIQRFLFASLHTISTHRLVFMIGFGLLVVSALLVARHVKVDDMGSHYFAKTNQFRQSDDFINSHIAGTSPGWIEIDTHKENGAIDLNMVNFIDRMEQFIHQQSNVTFSYSIARYIRRINYTLNDYNLQYNRLPYAEEVIMEPDEDGTIQVINVKGNDIIRQSVLMYENGGGTDLTNVLNSDFSKTTLLYTMNTTLASEYQQFLDKLVPWLDENIPQGASYKLAGSPVIWTSVLGEMWQGQKTGIFISFISIFVIMCLWFRSVRYGFFGTLPLVLTVIFYFSFMSISNIELNIGTAIISFLVLGVVDYSVHYIMRMKSRYEEGADAEQALHYAISSAGNAIVINIIVFFVGFMPLLFSAFRPIFDVGLLVGTALFLSGVLTIFTLSLFSPFVFPKRKS